ncbi:MAG TPA: histidine kinase dimerization/phospho-acceptor domain-containing protein, partial [Solirubrobacterales bacterium]|nr:histidine kinase dimerization/phospho-acceptor domain-containing protein [Solirubrobacterales bacterium]
MSGSLANRMRIGFAIAFAALVGVTVLGAASIYETRHNFEQATTRSFESEIAAERMRQTFLIEQMALPAAGAGDRRSAQRLERARRDGAAAEADARALAGGEAETVALIDARAAAAERWRARVAQPVLARRAPPEAVQRRLGQQVLNADRDLIRSERERRVELSEGVADSTRDTTLLLAAGIGCGLFAAVLLFTWLVASMRRPLEQLMGAAGRLAGGDLETRVRIGGPTETVALGRAFNEMAAELQTAHRHTEQNRARLASILESLADGVITTDRKGRIVEANPAARRILPGVRVGELAREAFGDALDEAQLERLVGGAIESEIGVGAGEQVLAITSSALGRAPGGDSTSDADPASEGASVAGAARAEGAVISVRDISERARLERLKDEFVLTASHELRSPLTSVQGFAELLQLEREGLSPRQAETVEIILDSTRHLVRLLNDLLDLARSDAGQLQISPEPTEVAPLVETAARAMQAQTDSKSQRLTWEVAPGLPPVMAQPDRVRQILANLLSNASEYCPEGAKIEIAVQPADAGAGSGELASTNGAVGGGA